MDKTELDKLQKDNDEMIKKTIYKLNKIVEDIHLVNCELYETKLNHLDKHELKQEYADCIGDGEFDLMMYDKGEKFIKEFLLDYYCAGSYERLCK